MAGSRYKLPAMANRPRVKLSIGASGAVKAITLVIAVIMLGISAFVALVAYGIAYGAQTAVTSSLNDGQWHLDKDGKLVPGPGPDEPVGGAAATIGWTAAACALLVALFAGYLILRVLRTSAWLEGSMLHVRGALRTKKLDLATAAISGGSKLQSAGDRSVQRVELIKAADPASGKSVTLPLRGRGSELLPAEELRMLANAITNTRVRSGLEDSAFVVAEHLRGFARDPFS